MLNTVLKVYVPAQVFVARQAKLFAKRTEGASGIEYGSYSALYARRKPRNHHRHHRCNNCIFNTRSAFGPFCKQLGLARYKYLGRYIHFQNSI